MHNIIILTGFVGVSQPGVHVESTNSQPLDSQQSPVPSGDTASNLDDSKPDPASLDLVKSSESEQETLSPSPAKKQVREAIKINSAGVAANTQQDQPIKIIARGDDEKLSIPVSIPLHKPVPEPQDDSHNLVDSETPFALPEPVSQAVIDFSIKMREGHTVRQYQQELAQPGIDGVNYIIVAPTGSGKTLVAIVVISDHLTKKQDSAHIVFVVNTKPLAEQQKKQLDDLIPAARVGAYTGDTDNMVADSIKERNHITVCTAGKLLDEIRKGKVTFDQLSLMVFDECHHTKKGHPYARLMEHYLEHKDDGGKCPQIIGMTASPGAGNNHDLEKEKTIDHLLVLVARLDATGGLQTVSNPENVRELQHNTKNSTQSLKVLPAREAAGDPFVCKIESEMQKLEKTVPGMKNNHVKRWFQEYETVVQQLKLPLESSTDKSVRDQISTLNLLRCYSNALNVYMDLQQKDAIKVMESYTGLPEDEGRATEQERGMKASLKALLQELRMLPPQRNPILENMKEILCENFDRESPTSRAIVFVRTKKHAYSLKDWVREHQKLRPLINPGVITGHTRDSGAGMTQAEQEDIMSSFRKGDTNLLIATSVAEEGLDVPECNLVIRFHHVSNEIAKVQTEGRARAENSQGFTILSSDSKKKSRELKNSELVLLVEEILENKWFPSGAHLQEKIAKIQRGIMNDRKLKALRRETQIRKHMDSKVKLFCRQCKIFACNGEDIYTIGEASFHYVVPHSEFQDKITAKPHPDAQTPLIANEVLRTHKIHCASCEKYWGVKCIWPHDGNTFPVIKCSSFNFEIDGVPKDVKKWSQAPFKMDPLSCWLEKSGSETSFSESDSELGSD